jgi:hypothetical protein
MYVLLASLIFALVFTGIFALFGVPVRAAVLYGLGLSALCVLLVSLFASAKDGDEGLEHEYREEQ